MKRTISYITLILGCFAVALFMPTPHTGWRVWAAPCGQTALNPATGKRDCVGALGANSGITTINTIACTLGSSCTVPIGVSRLFSQTSLVSLTGVTAATTLLGTGTGSLTLPANQFANAGDILHILWYGTYSSGASATTSTYSLLLGASTVAQGTLTGTATANTSPCSMDVMFTAQTVGVGGTIIADGTMTCGGTAAGAAGVVFGLGNAATAVTINTTTTQVFDFKVAPGANAMVHKTTNFILTNY